MSTNCDNYGHIYLRDSELDTCSVCKEELMLMTVKEYEASIESIAIAVWKEWGSQPDAMEDTPSTRAFAKAVDIIRSRGKVS